jgi:hypothetical protein
MQTDFRYASDLSYEVPLPISGLLLRGFDPEISSADTRTGRMTGEWKWYRENRKLMRTGSFDDEKIGEMAHV